MQVVHSRVQSGDITNQVIQQKNFDKRLFNFTGVFMDWKLQTVLLFMDFFRLEAFIFKLDDRKASQLSSFSRNLVSPDLENWTGKFPGFLRKKAVGFPVALTLCGWGNYLLWLGKSVSGRLVWNTQNSRYMNNFFKYQGEMFLNTENILEKISEEQP